MICEGMGLPEGLICYIKSLYTNNKFFYRGDGKTKMLYEILSGIIEGCPLLGSIFDIVVDPSLRLLKKSRPNSTNRTFADDIGTIIQKLDDLKTLKSYLDLFNDISGLDFKIKKCCLIPLGHDPTAKWMKQVSKMIAKIVANWVNFIVALSAEYLGIIIGPKGGAIASWEKTLLKYVDRTNLIAHANIAPPIGVDLYA